MLQLPFREVLPGVAFAYLLESVDILSGEFHRTRCEFLPTGVSAQSNFSFNEPVIYSFRVAAGSGYSGLAVGLLLFLSNVLY